MTETSVHDMDALASIAEDDVLYVEAGDGSYFGKVQIGSITAPIHTLHVETVANGDYVLTFDAPYAGTITTLRTKTESGTCTVTGYINGVALGGTANSASTTAQEQAHASANAYAKGDEIKITVTSNSSAVDLEVTFYGTRTDL